MEPVLSADKNLAAIAHLLACEWPAKPWQVWFAFESAGLYCEHMSGAFPPDLFRVEGRYDGQMLPQPAWKVAEYPDAVSEVRWSILPRSASSYEVAHAHVGEWNTQGKSLFLEAFRAEFGEPVTYSDPTGAEFFWWFLGSDMCLRVGFAQDWEIRLAFRGRPDGLTASPFIPDSAQVVEQISRWSEPTFPMSLELFYSLCRDAMWRESPLSSRVLFSDACARSYDDVERGIESHVLDGDVVVAYEGASSVVGVRFPLAACPSLHDEASAWPRIASLMEDVLVHLQARFGEGEEETGLATRRRWVLPSGATLTCEWGGGQSWVTVAAPGISASEVEARRFLYSTEEVLELLRFWLEFPRPIFVGDFHEAAQSLKWTDCSEEDEDSLDYSTEISPLGETSAFGMRDGDLISALTFTVAAEKYHHQRLVSPTHVDSTMAALRHALCEQWGEPREVIVRGCRYCEWTTPTGLGVRIVFGREMSEVWVYEPQGRETVNKYCAGSLDTHREEDCIVRGEKYTWRPYDSRIDFFDFAAAEHTDELLVLSSASTSPQRPLAGKALAYTCVGLCLLGALGVLVYGLSGTFF